MAFIGNSSAPFPAADKPKPPPAQSSGVIPSVLNICALLAFVEGVYVTVQAESAVHHILAGICAIVFVCALAGAAIIRELRRLG